jgi:phage N-6-adenine-methyltransferase
MSVSGATETAPESSWQTPTWLVDRIHAAFGGGIDLDPCTTEANPTRATSWFYPPIYDGILWSWADPAKRERRIFVNPPYGRTIALWMDKCADAAAGGGRVIALVPAWTGTKWFQRAVRDATEICLVAGRIDFNNVKGRGKFSSVLIGFNQTLEKFDDLGIILREWT